MTVRRYPWYDAPWLTVFASARTLIGERYPSRIADFDAAFAGFRTRPDFKTVKLNHILGAEDLSACREQIASLSEVDLDKREFFKFGRLIKQDLPLFVEMQNRLTDRVSELAGEAVEPSYNFLSLYNNLGVCEMHLDSPRAKWTLDICVDQSYEWPLHLSNVVPWPESVELFGGDWRKAILGNGAVKFEQHTHEPGDGLLFSGSSQWHYRERIPRSSRRNYSHLIFFHYFPCGMRQLASPECWADWFGIAELNEVVDLYRKSPKSDSRHFERPIVLNIADNSDA